MLLYSLLLLVRRLFLDRLWDYFDFAFGLLFILKLHKHAFLPFFLIFLKLNELCLGKSPLNSGLLQLRLLLKDNFPILYFNSDALIFRPVSFFDLFVGFGIDNDLRRSNVRRLLFLGFAIFGPGIFNSFFLFFRVFFSDVDYIFNEACISSSLRAVWTQVFNFLILSHPPLYLEHFGHISNPRRVQFSNLTFVVKHYSLVAQIYSHPLSVNFKKPLPLLLLFLCLQFLSPSQNFNILIFFFI